MRAKQVELEAEKGQLEASIIANCGGLDATEAPSIGNFSDLWVFNVKISQF